MAAFAELVIDQGTTYNSVITITDDATGLPMNIVGYSISSQARKSYYSLYPSITFSKYTFVSSMFVDIPFIPR